MLNLVEDMYSRLPSDWMAKFERDIDNQVPDYVLFASCINKAKRKLLMDGPIHFFEFDHPCSPTDESDSNSDIDSSSDIDSDSDTVYYSA